MNRIKNWWALVRKGVHPTLAWRYTSPQQERRRG